MIPPFPDFKRIEPLDKDEINEFIRMFPPYEDFRFINLWSFDIADDVLISKLHDNFVVRFHDYTSSDQFYSFIGTKEIKNTIEELLKRATKEKVLPHLKLIPEEVILSDTTLSNDFDISEDRDNFDYIMSLKDLSNMPGKKYESKRKGIHRFIRSNPNIKVELLDLKKPELHQQLLNTFYTWEKRKGLPREETEHELLAIKKLLRIVNVLDLHVTGLYDDKLMIGFIINEIAHDNFAIGHFIKVDPSMEGIYEFFYKTFADQLLLQGCTHINIQQDLGIPGLRNSKMHWRPAYFLKKYTIGRRS